MKEVEKNQSSGSSEKNLKWVDLGKVPFKQAEESEATEKGTDKREKLLERAALYRQFGKVAIALTNLEEAVTVDTHEALVGPEDEQARALLKQLESALGDVDRSLGNQISHSIINHKQINTKDALEAELQSGTSIPELDIRFDKDGKPWISHSPRAGARFFFSKPIHELSSEEVEGYGKRLSLEDGLDIFKQYKEDNDDHRVVLEIKELGPSAETREQYLGGIKAMLEERELTDAVVFATLSPSILKSVHEAFPENAKILNGGIAPVISYDLAEKSLGSDADQEFAVKIPNVELFFSNSTEVAERADGYGKQTGYLWTRLPKETVEVLASLNKNDSVGAASLTLVNKFANILDKLSPKTAESLRRHYAMQLEKLGLRKQVAISKRKPAESLKRTKEQMGDDAIIYSDTSPGDWAADL